MLWNVSFRSFRCLLCLSVLLRPLGDPGEKNIGSLLHAGRSRMVSFITLFSLVSWEMLWLRDVTPCTFSSALLRKSKKKCSFFWPFFFLTRCKLVIDAVFEMIKVRLYWMNEACAYEGAIVFDNAGLLSGLQVCNHTDPYRYEPNTLDADNNATTLPDIVTCRIYFSFSSTFTKLEQNWGPDTPKLCNEMHQYPAWRGRTPNWSRHDSVDSDKCTVLHTIKY